MISHIFALLGADDYYPHEICLSYDPVMLWAYSVSDLMICGSYVVIGAVIAVLRFCGFQFSRLTISLLATFILLCGLTHLTEAVELYVTVYRIDLMLRIATAVVSTATATQMLRRLRAEVQRSRDPG